MKLQICICSVIERLGYLHTGRGISRFYGKKLSVWRERERRDIFAYEPCLMSVVDMGAHLTRLNFLSSSPDFIKNSANLTKKRVIGSVRDAVSK